MEEFELVKQLIDSGHEESIKEVYFKGNIRALRDKIGHRRFDALKLFFRTWMTTSTLYKEVVPSSAIKVARKLIFSGDSKHYPKNRGNLLQEFVHQLNATISDSGKYENLSEI